MATKVYKTSEGKVILVGGKAIEAPVTRNEYGNTGTVDAAGLAELGWNANDIAWLQKVCWWDAEDNDLWKVSAANKAFGPNGATPITWSNISTYAGNTDIVFFPKLANTALNVNVTTVFPNLLAIPTDGWTYFSTGDYNNWIFYRNPQLISVGNLNALTIYAAHLSCLFAFAANIRFKGWFKPVFYSAGTSLRYWFGKSDTLGQCCGFRKVDLTNIDFSQVTDDYCIFVSGSIEAVKIDKWNYAGTEFGMFFGTARLKDIYVNEVTVSWKLGDCPNLTRESCLRIFNALSSSSTGTITMHANAKARLSAADMAIATNKGWTIA